MPKANSQKPEIKKVVPTATTKASQKQNLTPQDINEPEQKTGTIEKTSLNQKPINNIPTTSPDASLKIENITHADEQIPNVDINASLKIDKAAENTEKVPLEQKNRIIFLAGVIIAILILGISGSLLYLRSKSSTIVQNEVLEVKTEKASPSPEAASFDRTSWSVEVLNGSTTSGKAGVIAGKLSALGYKIVKIGNAASKDYVKSEVFIKLESKNQSETFLKDLGEITNTDETIKDLNDSTASARIIIGKE